MQIVASQSAGFGLGRHHDPFPAPKPADVPARAVLPAVVPGQADKPPAVAPRHRPVTALLAQLVAIAENMPTARAQRRADPGTGAEAYRAVAGLGSARPQARSRIV
jgi:hypothetical protein